MRENNIFWIVKAYTFKSEIQNIQERGVIAARKAARVIARYREHVCPSINRVPAREIFKREYAKLRECHHELKFSLGW